MSDKRTDLPSPTAPNFQQRVREALQTYLGRQGDPLDRGLTLRDLIAAGVIRLRDGFPLRPGSGVPPIEPAVPGQEDYVPDLTPPPTPTGFLVSAGISYVFVEHDQPSYTNGHGHLRTRLYGATHESGNPLPTFDDAVELSQFSGRVYAYPTNPATTWHLWIKWESVDGGLSLPAGGTNGQSVTTGQNVSDLLEVLNGQLSESQLAAALNTRINLIDNPTTGLQAQVSALDSEVSTLQGQVAALEGTPTYDPLVTYAQGDMVQYNGSLYIAKSSTTGNDPTNTTYWDLVGQYASLGEAVQALTVDVADHENRIGVVEGGLGAEVTARETLAAQMRGSYTGTDVTQLTQGLVWSERQARATAVSAEASARDALATQLRGTYAGTDLNLVTSGLIASERVARSNAIGTVTTEINTLRSDAQTWDGQVFTNAQSWVQGNYLTAADTNSAISSAVNTVNARLNSGGDTYNAIVQSQTTASAKNATFVQSATPTATKLNDLWIHTGQQNKLYRWDGTSWVVADDQRIGSTASQVTTLSSTVQNVSDTVDGLTNDVAALEISASTSANNITGLQAQYTVKVDVNGYVSGYGLASTANNGTPSSEFIVVADKFSIAPVATNPGAADGSPFYHLTVPTTVNGVTVPAGTYMKAAYIADATIGRAMIQDAAIDDAKIANLSAAKITAGTITAEKIAAGAITADKITAGAITSGKIAAGAITADKIAAGTITGGKIAADTITGNKIAAGTITADKIDSRGLSIKNAAGDVILAAGTPLTEENFAGGISNNMVFNADFTDGLGGTFVGWRSGGNQHTLGINLVDYRLLGEGTAYSHMSGTPAAGVVWDIEIANGTQGRRYQVEAGKKYEIGALINAHRCIGKIGIAFYNSSGAAIAGSEFYGNDVAYPAYPSGTIYSTSDMGLSWGIVTAPAGAVTAYLFIRGVSDGQSDCYVFFSRLYLGQAGAVQTEPSRWTPGKGITQITSANASTYIANAAIGTAQIGDLQVSTLKIGQNAVTVPLSSSGVNFGTVSANTFPFTIITLSASYDSDAGLLFIANVNAASTSGANSRVRVRILIDDSIVVYDGFGALTGGMEDTFMFSSNSTIAAGTHSFQLQIGNNWGAGAWNCTSASFSVLGTKR